MDEGMPRRCRQCGTDFHPREAKHVYCSSLCCDRHRNREKMRRQVQVRTCACGKEFVVRRRSPRLHCGDASCRPRRGPLTCAINWRCCSGCSRWYTTRGRRRCPCDLSHRTSRPPRCLQCGAAVRAGVQACEACKRATKQEARRRRKRRHRARLRSVRTEDYRSADIFERDGWRCHLCKRLVSRSKVVPHPLAPVVDHLVPIAKGGDDVQANIACAHFLCNSLKGDRTFGNGDQLRLIG